MGDLIMLYQPTPIQEIKGEWNRQQVRLLIKREDMNHPFCSGNKWWKLKYNLEEARTLGHHTLLTFGGAYSNHLYATAAAANELGFKSIGIVRGEEVRPLNATLAFAESCGMKLHFVSRGWYRTKISAESVRELQLLFGDFYLIPEGGTNHLAVKGCTEWAQHLTREVQFTHCCLPVGTGGTMAGLLEGFGADKKVIGFPVLKGAEFLREEVSRFTQRQPHFQFQYHFGGYAKTTPTLLDFMSIIETAHGLTLDQVYTAKMMFGVLDLVYQNFFERNATVLMLHTGGLQGRLRPNDSP